MQLVINKTYEIMFQFLKIDFANMQPFGVKHELKTKTLRIVQLS
jgi:hypothetical protein